MLCVAHLQFDYCTYSVVWPRFFRVAVFLCVVSFIRSARQKLLQIQFRLKPPNNHHHTRETQSQPPPPQNPHEISQSQFFSAFVYACEIRLMLCVLRESLCPRNVDRCVEETAAASAAERRTLTGSISGRLIAVIADMKSLLGLFASE